MAKEKVFFKTFGCRTNWFDTQVMMSNLKDFEVCSSELESDIIVVNSCTVTNGADSSVRGYINAIKRKNPNAKVIIAGCGAHSKGESLLKAQKVFGVMGHSEKEKINQILKEENPFYQIGDLSHIDKTVVSHYIGRSRAFIKIQEGCDFECSYCIIPSVRGLARSYSPQQIKEQVTLLASNGFGEFILTGTNVGSYGRDINFSLAKLLKELSQIRGVRRVRIGSLEPIQIDDEFMEILLEPWMARHLHIAIQHTSDKMLQIMDRRNRFDSDLKLFEKISSFGYAIGTDFIVGHAGESDEVWQEAIKRVKMMPLTHIHAFTYSKRDGTKSANLKEQPPKGDIAKARHKELTRIIDEKNLAFRQKNHTDLIVLAESKRDDGLFSGFDQYYNKILIDSKEDISSSWLLVKEAEVESKFNYAVYPE
jgi:MiaB-like tRNA modifying enzyme